MKRFLCITAAVVLCLAGSALGAAKQEMKRMGVFLSNFTEAGLFNFDIRAEFDEGENERAGETRLHLGMPENSDELIRFGIIHNLINNYESRIRKCRDPECESGALTIDRKFIEESVRKYFGLRLTDESFESLSGNQSVSFSYDGKLLHFDADSFREPGNDTVYYAEVQDVDEGRYLTLSGEIYDSRRPKRRPGTFSAFVIPSGKSWLIISMTTSWKTDRGLGK